MFKGAVPKFQSSFRGTCCQSSSLPRGIKIQKQGQHDQ